MSFSLYASCFAGQKRREGGREGERGSKEGNVELTPLSFLPSLRFSSYLPTDALDSIAKWSTHISTVSPLLHSNISTPAPILKDNIFHVIRLVPSEPSSSSSSSLEETSAGVLIGTIRIWTSHDEKTDGDKVGVMDVGYYLSKEFAGKGVMGRCVQALTSFWEAWEGREEDRRVKAWEAHGESFQLELQLGSEADWTKESEGDGHGRVVLGLTFVPSFRSLSLIVF